MVDTTRLPGVASDSWFREPQRRIDALAVEVANLRRAANQGETVAPDAPEYIVDKTFGDGVTDATSHLQEVMDKAGDAGGGTVIIPPGDYLITEVVNLRANLVVRGYGATILRGAFQWMMFVNYEPGDTTTTGYNGYSNITVEGLTFDGREGDPTFVDAGTPSQCLTFQSCRDITVRDCTFTRNNLYHQLELNAVDGAIVENCDFKGTNSAGSDYREMLQIDCASPGNAGAADGTMARNITVRNCRFGWSDNKDWPMHAAGIGSHTDPNNQYYDNIHIDGCTFTDPWQYAIRGWHWRNFRITNNHVSSVLTQFIAIESFDCHNGVISGNTLVGYSGGLVDAGAAISPGENGSHINVTGNAITAFYQGIAGPAVQSAITNNLITDVGNYGISYGGSDGLIEGNVIRETGYRAIRLYGTGTNNSVTSNTYRPGSKTPQTGLSIAAGQTGVWAVGNDFLGASQVTDGTISTTTNRI